MGSNLHILLPSCCLHRPHSPKIERRTDELELGLHAVQSSQAELTDSQHALDPAVGRLSDQLASAVG